MSIASRMQMFLGTSDAYKSIFKAGFVLVAAATIALGQVGPELYSKDLEANKLRFEAEYLMKVPITKTTDCTSAGENIVACRIAVHHMKSLDATLGLWQNFIELAACVGVALMGLGFVGFLMPLFGKPASS